MPELSTVQLRSILVRLQEWAAGPADVIISLLKNTELMEDRQAYEARVNEVLNAMKDSPTTKQSTLNWAQQLMMRQYAEQLLSLVSRATGALRFSAHNATEERLAAIDIEDIAMEMKSLAPDLWDLVGVLLNADPILEHRRDIRRQRSATNLKKTAQKGNTEEEDYAEEWYRIHAPKDIDNDLDPKNNPPDTDDDTVERRKALLVVKQVVCMSIMVQSTNQCCNALQSLIGLYLHACNSPEAVVELLAHIGVSISTSAINDAVSSLSKESSKQIRELAATLLTAYAYDNVDIDLKHTPTIENSFASLIHLTSGTLIQLGHGVTQEDLDCADQIHQLRQRRPEPVTDLQLASEIHPETGPDSATGLYHRDRFNYWIYLRDLVQHGPDYFRQFTSMLRQEKPDSVDAIPVEKSKQIHARMMDTPCSTPAQNADVIENLVTKQGGVGDPNDPALKDKPNSLHAIDNHVVLVYGDLGVGERIESLLQSRSEENTRWRRLNNVVYSLGLFHVKMAAADTIWRTFIEPPQARNESDEFSLMADVKVLRPKETVKISTKPGFRRMHEVILHSGIVSRLDCWRVQAASSNTEIKSLTDFAATKPSWQQLKEMAAKIAIKYVARSDFSKLRMKAVEERDQVNENMLLRSHMFLLYEQLSQAMNDGDIGWVETLFLPWAYIFQASGKHKYASALRKYLSDIHFHLPKRLARAIRMHILVNPTGKPGKFRGVDWWVEHNNLFLKRIYGGKFSNHTKARILKESPLIGVFINARKQVQTMFRMGKLTSRHSGPNMERTFRALATKYAELQKNCFVKGRKTFYNIPDRLREGMHMAQTSRLATMETVINEDQDPDWEDIPEELGEEIEEQGDLEVDDY